MDIEEAKRLLFEDYDKMLRRYEKVMPVYEFGYAMIQVSTKMLMDRAPRHMVALETVRVATEEGIKWHVTEKAKNKKGTS